MSGELALSGGRSVTHRHVRLDRRPRTAIIGTLAGLALVGALLIYGQTRPHFEIAAGDSLIKHMSTRDEQGYLKSIDIAQQLKLPVYRRDLGSNGVIGISYEEARQLARSTDWVLVDVPVYAGDQIDLRWFRQHFVPAPGKPTATDR